MGAGSRFKFWRSNDGYWGISVFVSRFPYSWTFGIGVLVWHMEIGVGKAYDAD